MSNGITAISLHFQKGSDNQCTRCGQALSVEGYNYPRVRVLSKFKLPPGYKLCEMVNLTNKVDPKNDLPF